MRACSCVVSEPRINDCSSDSPSAGETPIASASRRAFSSTSRSRRKSRVGWPVAALDLGDLAADGLPLRNQLQQFAIEVVEAGTEFVE